MLLFTSTLAGGPPGPAYTVGGEGNVSFASVWSLGSSNIQTSRFVPAVSGKLVACSFYINDTTAVTIRFGIYSDVDTLPSALLAQAQAAPVNIAGWREIEFAPADYPDITAASAFWLAFQVNVTIPTRLPATPVATHGRRRSFSFANPLPDPFASTANETRYSLRYKIWTNP